MGGKGQAGKGRAPVQEAQLALLQSLVQAGTGRPHAPEALRRLPAAQLLPSLRMCQVLILVLSTPLLQSSLTHKRDCDTMNTAAPGEHVIGRSLFWFLICA